MGRIWKVIGSVLAVAVIAAFGFCTVWTVRNWNTVYSSLDGSSVYTNDDIKKTEQEAYQKAAKNEAEYQNTIAELRDLVTGLQVENAALSDEVAALTLSISSNESEIRQLTIRKSDLESQVASLQDIKTDNENMISMLNIQAAELQVTVNNLQSDKTQNESTIASLNSQIVNLQLLAEQLQESNRINTNTITSLNTQISGLNQQISNMALLSQSATSQINALNIRINALEESISYYESYIATFENNEKVVATFEYDGSVYNVQIVAKGSHVSIIDPVNTDYKVFNGWKVNGETVDLANYTINEATKFVADLTYKYDVKFMVDDQIISSNIITENSVVVKPANPTKAGYRFDYWTLDGVTEVNLNNYRVTESLTFIAKFSQIFEVEFKYNNHSDTVIVLNGNLIPSESIPDYSYYGPNNHEFVGWEVNGEIVDFTVTPIYTNMVAVAKFEPVKVTVKFSSSTSDYVNGYEILVPYGTAIGNIDYIPEAPEDYVFAGWVNSPYTIDSEDYIKYVAGWVVDLESYTVNYWNANLYPYYEKAVFTITLQDNGHIIKQKVNKGEDIDLSFINPANDVLGYEFVHWVDSSCIDKYGEYFNTSNSFSVELPYLTNVTSDSLYIAYYMPIFGGEYIGDDVHVFVEQNIDNGKYYISSDIGLEIDNVDYSLNFDYTANGGAEYHVVFDKVNRCFNITYSYSYRTGPWNNLVTETKNYVAYFANHYRTEGSEHWYMNTPISENFFDYSGIY